MLRKAINNQEKEIITRDEFINFAINEKVVMRALLKKYYSFA